MPRLTERVQLTVPADVKAAWKAEAAARGLSLSAYLRDVMDTMLIADKLEQACAEVEFRLTGATPQ